MPPPRRVWTLLGIAFVALLSGCGQADESATPQTSTTYVLRAVVSPPSANPGPLPAGACFEATANYGVALLVEEEAPAGLCAQLDGYLPREAGRAEWPLPETGDEGQDTPSLECAVGRKGVRVEALSWQRGPSRVDPYDVCRRMVEDGWELRPQVEPAEADAPYGTCFVATDRYEVAITGMTERGQPLCDDLAEKYLPVIAYRAVPAADPDALGDARCEATRGQEVVRVVSMPGDRGKVDLRAICGALEGDGWNVSLWGS
jgi:hypothetical protein